MRSFFIVLIIIFVSNATQAQKALLFKDYIDYYRENVKSTILTKEGGFLKSGKYKFTGSPKDFKFLLYYVLKYNIADFKLSDTLTYEGEIKDSLKVNVWRLTLNRKDKPLDLIYHKKNDVVVAGVNFSENNYGLVNDIISLKQYYEDGSLYFMNLGGTAIQSSYNFGLTDYYVTKNEYYIDKKNKFISNFKITDKKDNKTYYYEKLSHTGKVNVEQRKWIYYNKESYFQYNDSCSLEIKTEMMRLKDNNKINKYVFQNILYCEIHTKKSAGDISYPDKKVYIKIDVSEGIKGDKLVELKFDLDNTEIKSPFTDLLKTNYYPFILYDVARIE